MDEARVPIPLSSPLRPFRPEDAATCAMLNNAASGGIVEWVWRGMEEERGMGWEEIGRLRQVERMNDGQIMVVADEGQGCVGAMMGHSLKHDPEDPASVPKVFAALVELENLVLGAWYVNILGTVPEARGRGHGTRLLAAADEIARQTGHQENTLIVSDANETAMRLYAAVGYRERARRPMVKEGWDGPGDNWLLLAKLV